MTTYTFKSKEELNKAVDMWCNKRKQAKTKYGPISNWNVSNIDDMSDLFYMKKYFNDDISRWDVSNVKNMDNMFSFASRFNQSLNDWKVHNVETMIGMFADASKYTLDTKWHPKTSLFEGLKITLDYIESNYNEIK